MKIVAATENDIPVIQHIASLTWPIAYAEIISPRQLGYMLNKMYDTSTLLSQMNEEEHLFFLCYDNEAPIGFAGISPVHYKLNSDDAFKNPWKLHKLYVLPQAQGTGAGRKLMTKCLESIAAYGGDAIILNVNRQNPAYHFYLKKGFEVLEEVDLDIGAGFFMVDYIMGKKIQQLP